MAKLLRLRRGTDTQHTTFTGAEGEVTVNTTNDSLHVHDGTTAGGRELMRADKNNMPNSGVTAGTYGSSSAIPSITVDAKGLVTSATTSAIDSTSISNGTSNVSIASSGGNITATRAGSTKLTVTSTGINVTGTVDCDGVQCQGDALISAGSGVVQIRDNDSSTEGPAVCFVQGQKSDGSSRWTLGDVDSTGDVYLACAGSNTLYFQTNATNRVAINSNGLWPQATNTYDIGSSTNQFRDAYFDGTVNCDGLTCEGTATITSGNGVFFLKDSNNTGGTATQCYVSGRDSANSEVWYVGNTSSSSANVELVNTGGAGIRFGTSNTMRCEVDANGHFKPNATNTYDLGSSTLRWRNIYTNDLNLSNEGGSNDVDGTWGSWTIQEGEDDLFLLNRRNGKKYKFNLSEVN